MIITDSNFIGQAIRQQRKLKGLSQAQLSKKIDISLSTLSRYEKGERTLSEKTLKRIAIGLELPESYFLNLSQTFYQQLSPQDKLLFFRKLYFPSEPEAQAEFERSYNAMLANILANQEEQERKEQRKLLGKDAIALLAEFNKLNEKGKKTAINRLKELSQIPAYQAKDKKY